MGARCLEGLVCVWGRRNVYTDTAYLGGRGSRVRYNAKAGPEQLKKQEFSLSLKEYHGNLKPAQNPVGVWSLEVGGLSCGVRIFWGVSEEVQARVCVGEMHPLFLLFFLGCSHCSLLCDALHSSFLLSSTLSSCVHGCDFA